MRRPYSFVKRSLLGGIRYYVRFWLADAGKYSPARSAGSLADLQKIDTDKYRPGTKAGAEYIAAQIMAAGGWPFIVERESAAPEAVAASILPDESNPEVIPYLLDFWDWDKSEYIADRLEHKKRIGRLYCLNQRRSVELHLSKYIPAKMRIADLTPVFMKRLQSQVKKAKQDIGKKLSASAVNRIVSAITIPLKWLARLGVIPSNPAAILEEYESENEGRKGILSNTEARDLFAAEWEDERGRLAVAVAYYTGARLGEIAALYIDDLDTDFSGKPVLWIRASWSQLDERKETKNSTVRIVPIPETLADDLKALYKKNPTDSKFIFWDALDDKKPFSRKMIEGAFNRQLAKIGIDAEARARRRLSMHSLRHGFNASLRGAIPDVTLRKAVGHLTASMSDHYDHTTDADLKAIRDAQESRIMLDFESGVARKAK